MRTAGELEIDRLRRSNRFELRLAFSCSCFRRSTLHRATQRPIEIGMRRFEIADDLEVDTLHLRQIDLLDVNETQKFADGLRHFASALVARAAALRNADLCPELFLIESEASPDLARIQNAVK